LRRDLLLAGALALLPVLAAAAGSAPPRKQLIEFGWDEPNPRFMREHIAELQASPFDGCVFHVDYARASGDSDSFTWNLWGHRRFESGQLAPALADLQSTSFGRFRENFLRVNVTPADLDWFEDHGAVLVNLELAARLAKQGGCRGVLFDVEQYRGKLWDFREQTKQRPRSWDEMSARVRALGAEAMRALERGYPGVTVFMTFAYSMPLDETGISAGAARRALRYSHLFHGMVSAASDSAVIVDGHEASYPYRDPAQFAAKADSMRHGARRLAAQPDRYVSRLSVGFGIWLDFNWTKLGWDAHDPMQNHFTPGSFAVAVQAALDHADRYVWIYTEKPQWWSRSGGPRALPAAYDSVLRAARR
jgi:hypothetical protein